MFYYTFSVINTMYDPCTGLLYDSTAATWTLKLSPCDFSSDDVLSCLWIVFTNSVFQVPPQKIVRRVEILGIGWPGVIGLTQNESVLWGVMSEVFRCLVRKMRRHLISRTEHLNTSHVTCILHH